MQKIQLSLAALLLTATPALAQQYLISQPVGGDNFGARATGQTFTPSIGIAPDPGMPATIPLTRITLYAGNSGAAAPSTTTFLNLYDGDPNAGGNFVASSTNSLDTNGLTFRTPLVWTFAQPALNYNTEYWAVMSSTGTAGGLDIAVSLETEPRNGPPGPDIYTGGTGLIAGYAPHPASQDTRFEVEFFVGVRGSFGVSGRGCPSSAGDGVLGAQSFPRVGQPWQVDVTNAAPAGIPFLVIGVSDSFWNGGPLPISLNLLLPFAAPSCQIEVSVDLAAPMIPGTTAALSLPIPGDVNLAGSRFYVQAYQLEAATISVTGKGTAVIGT